MKDTKNDGIFHFFINHNILFTKYMFFDIIEKLEKN